MTWFSRFPESYIYNIKKSNFNLILSGYMTDIQETSEKISSKLTAITCDWQNVKIL